MHSNKVENKNKNTDTPASYLMYLTVAVAVVIFLACIIIGYVSWSIFFIRPSPVPEITPPNPSVLEDQIASKNTEKGEPQEKNATADYLVAPDGFRVEVFADEISSTGVSTPGPNTGPRLMLEYNGAVLTSVMKEGYVESLIDKNKDGFVEDRTVFIDGLKNPHGLAAHNGWIYIADQEKIIRVRDDDQDHVADQRTAEIIYQFPERAGNHITRTIKVFDGKLYITIGSTCNSCIDPEPYAAMLTCELDGTNCATFATGLRNTVDFIQYNNKIYGTDNGRDRIGNDIPPDEINIIEQGKNYGWPHCYGRQVYDESTNLNNICESTEPSFIDLPAHVAPLGIDVFEATTFPQKYQNTFFVAYHGSWNRNPPSGYKVVSINPMTKKSEDFITGFRDGDGIQGRPVGILEYHGSLLISDDNAGRIYRVVYEE